MWHHVQIGWLIVSSILPISFRERTPETRTSTSTRRVVHQETTQAVSIVPQRCSPYIIVSRPVSHDRKEDKLVSQSLAAPQRSCANTQLACKKHSPWSSVTICAVFCDWGRVLKTSVLPMHGQAREVYSGCLDRA